MLLESRLKRPSRGAPWTVTDQANRIAQHVRSGGNVGLVTHQDTGVAVLDPDKLPPWADMMDALGAPATAWVETASGRLHYYVAWEPDLPAKLIWGGEPIGEIQRGPGQQQVVIPPSMIDRPYQWLVDPATEPLGPLPGLWRAYLASLSFRQDRLLSVGTPTAQPELLEAALRQPGARRRSSGLVKFQCPGCMGEGHDAHRDNAAYFVATATWGCAWAKDTGVGRAHWEAIGLALGALGRSPAPISLPPAQPLGIGLGQFIAQTFTETEPLIEGLLSADGCGWLAGEEKVGKTFWALDEALALALGQPVAGKFHVPKRQRVLFIEEEDPPRRAHGRIRPLLRGRGLDPDNPAVRAELDEWFRIEVWSGFTLDDLAWVARLEATCAAFAPAVAYIDVLRKVTAKDINKQVDMSPLLARLDAIRRMHRTVFRIVHHYRKQQGFRTGRGSQEMGGSFVLGAWGECSLFFEPVGRKQGAVRVEVQTKDGPPVSGFNLVLHAEGPAHAPTLLQLTAEDTVDDQDSDDGVFQAIATLPKTEAAVGRPGVTVAALVAALKKSDKTIRRALKRLVEAKRVLVTGKTSKQADLYGVNAE